MGLASLERVIKRNSEDISFFGAFCLPSVITKPFPTYYQELFLYIIQKYMQLGEKDFSEVVMYLAIALPRGHAKTTFFKLIIAYGIIHDLFTCIIVVGANESRASDFINDVDNILKSENVRKVYGNWAAGLTVDNTEEKQGVYRNKPRVLVAVGAGTSFRGINKLNSRPDFILFDDAQTAEGAESAVESKKLLRWLVGTAIKTKNPARCGVVWIGNAYTPKENCILYKLIDSPSWDSLVTGAILADGTALWEDLYSLKALRAEYAHDASLGLADVFFAEVQNQPIDSSITKSIFPAGNIPLTILSGEEEIIGSFITVDPAGKRKHSDETAIVGHHLYNTQKLHFAELVHKRMTPIETVTNGIDLAVKMNAPVIFVESVAYQESLAFWFNYFLDKMELSGVLKAVPLSIGIVSKLSRIRSFAGAIMEGDYIITDEDIRQAVLYQGLDYQIERTNNVDDILDSGGHGIIVRSNPDYRRLTYTGGIPIYSDETCTEILEPHVIKNQSYLDRRQNRYNG